MKKIFPLTIALLVILIIWVFVMKSKNYKTNKINQPSKTTQQISWFYNWTIKVWHLVALDMAPMFLAKEAGYFKEEWLDVETVFFSNPGDSNAALAWWELQFNINPFTLPFLAQNQWIPMRIISNAWGHGIIEVVIQWDYWLRNIEAITKYIKNNPWKKLKIWTLKGDTLDMIIYRSFLEKWLTYDDFEMIRFNDLLAMVQAFQTKQIDILWHIRPYTTELVLQYSGIVLTNNDQVWWKGTPNTTTVVMQSFMEKYPETIKAYLRAQKKWAALLTNNPEEAVKLLVKGNYYRVDKETLLFALRQYQWQEIILKTNVSGIKNAIDDMVTQGYIKPIDMSIITTSFLDQLWIK